MNTAATCDNNGEAFASPVRCFPTAKCLLLLVQLYAIADVYIFQREHHHACGSCWRRSDYDDFANCAAGVVSHVDGGAFPALGEHARLDVRLPHLRIFYF